MQQDHTGGFTPEELEIIRRYEKGKAETQQRVAEEQKSSLRLEQDKLLRDFDQDYGQINNTLNSKTHSNRVLETSEVQWVMGFIQNACNFLKLKHQPGAERLRQSGLPEVSNRLTGCLDDLQKAQKIWGEILQTREQAEAEMSQYWNDANKSIFETMGKANDDQKQTFTNANNAWWESFKKR